MKDTRKNIVVVLGMHRSGTSAITRGLSVLGVELGNELHPAGNDNPKGFWEDKNCLRINENLLAHLDSAYDGLSLSPHLLNDLKQDQTIKTLKLEAIEEIRQKFEQTRLCGFKDPRTSRLLPFWKDVFNEVDCEPRYLIVLRNPISVARSLTHRNTLESEKSYFLWLEHMVSAVLDSYGNQRMLVDYDLFMDQPTEQLLRIAKRLQLSAPTQDSTALFEFTEEFLEGNLRHTHFVAGDLQLDPKLPYDVLKIFELCQRFAKDEEDLDSDAGLEIFSSVRQRLQDYAPAFSYAKTLENRLDGFFHSVNERNDQIANLNARLAERETNLSQINRTLELVQQQAADSQLLIKSQLDQEKTRRLHSESAHKQSNKLVKLLTQERDEQSLQISVLKEAVSSLSRQNTSLEQENRQLLDEKIESAEWRVATEQATNEMLQAIGGVSNARDQLHELNQSLQFEINQLKQSNTQLHQEHQHTQEEHQRTQQKADHLGDQLGLIQSQHELEKNNGHHLHHQLAQANAQLARILNSKSWLLTEPLRFLRRSMISKPYWFIRRALSNAAHAAWYRLPLPTEAKQRFKDALFKGLPFLFRWSQAYRTWQNFTAAINYIPPAHSTIATGPTQLQVPVSADYIPLLQAPQLSSKPVKLICFYLPQFHPISENDAWWGEGFTEWSNVRPAQPQFAGHYQPHIPGELGYYSLLDPAVQRRQTELAKLYGIEGFCFYFYWFGGKRLLETPIENFLKDASLDLPFCLCWANENWSRRWDGLDSEILIAQQHSPEDDLAFITHVSQYMRDARYIRIDGKPLLLVYRPSLLPSAKETAERWRTWCRANGIGDIYLAYTQSFEAVDPAKYGFDAAIEFPPNNSAPPNITNSVTPLTEDFGATVYDWRIFVERSEKYRRSDYKLFRSVCPAWDNTARRKNRSTVFLNSSPALYRRWLENAIQDTEQNHGNPEEQLIFINAWNEWAEGAYMEPDAHYGYAYLQATRDALSPTDGNQDQSILLVTHDCHPHGAQFLILETAKQFKANGLRVAILALDGGRLLDDFAHIGRTLNAKEAGGHAMQTFLANLRAEGCADAITSTVVSGRVLPQLKTTGFRVLSLIHELPGVIREMQQEANAEAIAQHADKIVFPASLVHQRYCEITPVAAEKVVIRPQGVLRKNPYKNRRAEARRIIFKKHKLPADSQIVLSIGYVDSRKGADLFVEIAAHTLKVCPKAVFIWVGHAEQQMEKAVTQRIQQLGLQNRILFTGFDREPLAYYAAATAYALPSREDPFPNVVLESAEVGVPVVAFEGASGACDFVLEQGGRLARYLDVQNFAHQLCEILTNPIERTNRSVGSLQQYALDLLHHLNGFQRISVVVPNYNYGQHIGKRLDSIYRQNRPIYELIVLDDASSDNSVETIEKYLERSGSDGQLVVNQNNSGSVFRQWQKGLALSKGDLLWIAEVDDLANCDFLDELAPAFHDPSVVLAYSQSKQIDESGKVLALNYLDYTRDISQHWLTGYVRNGHEEISEALSIKNTIPNVSAVLFRRTALEQAFQTIGDDLFSYRVAGDWLIYLHALLQGKVYFCEKSLNQHRRHSKSVTSCTQGLMHLQEVCKVQEIARKLATPSAEALAKAHAYIEHLHEHFLVSGKNRKGVNGGLTQNI